MKLTTQIFCPLKRPLIGLAVGLALTTVLLYFLGESPMALLTSFTNVLFTNFGLGYTLFYLTPLILTGLSVAITFHCGLFNIGAEGQLYLGSVALVAFTQAFPTLPRPIALICGISAAALGGGLWGLLAGFLKAWRGTHEVIVTILLNFIGISIAEYCILYPLKNLEVQNPQTVSLPVNYQLSLLSQLTPLFDSTPVNTTLLLALVLCVVCWVLLYRTPIGFELRAAGANPIAAKFAGIPLKKRIMLSFFLSGALAGLVGVNEIMGHEHKLQQGFSPGYGFTGIAVALVANNHPIGIIFSALLFSALQNGSRELEFMSERVSKELSVVLQAILILFIALRYMKWRKK